MFNYVDHLYVNKYNYTNGTKIIDFPTDKNINFISACLWNGDKRSHEYVTIPLCTLVSNRIIEFRDNTPNVYATITVSNDAEKLTFVCNQEWYLLCFFF